jgi:hypothetical protein
MIMARRRTSPKLQPDLEEAPPAAAPLGRLVQGGMVYDADPPTPGVIGSGSQRVDPPHQTPKQRYPDMPPHFPTPPGGINYDYDDPHAGKGIGAGGSGQEDETS